MNGPIENAPIVGFDADPSPEQRAALLEEIRRAFLPPLPVPVSALQLLADTARADTGSSQAARSFLFWLAGQPDPTGYVGDGGRELRRLDPDHRAAAWEILHWWTGPIQTDEPLYQVLFQLRKRISSPAQISRNE